MRNLICLVLIVFLSSCLTTKRIQKNCDLFAQICISGTETETTTESRDTTIIVIDTVEVPLPADTVAIHDTVTVVNKLAFMPEIYRQFGNIAITAKVYNSIIDVKGFYVDSSFLYIEPDTIKIKGVVTVKTVEIINTVELVQKYIPKIYKICFYLVMSMLGLLIAFVAFKVFIQK